MCWRVLLSASFASDVCATWLRCCQVQASQDPVDVHRDDYLNRYPNLGSLSWYPLEVPVGKHGSMHSGVDKKLGALKEAHSRGTGMGHVEAGCSQDENRAQADGNDILQVPLHASLEADKGQVDSAPDDSARHDHCVGVSQKSSLGEENRVAEVPGSVLVSCDCQVASVLQSWQIEARDTRMKLCIFQLARRRQPAYC